MTDVSNRRADWGPGGKLVADGLMEGCDKATEVIDRLMAKSLPRGARIVIKTVRKAPVGVMKGAEVFTARDRLRALTGLAGGALGGAAGGALGAATGPAAPVGVPLGAAVGSVAGQHIAEELYDDHADEARRGIAATKAWIDERNAALGRGILNDFQRYTRPPQVRQPF